MRLLQDIGIVLTEGASFGNFATAVRTVRMLEDFSAKGPFTVFAPSNEAFNRLPADVFQALMDDKIKLKSVLSFHVAAGYMLVRNLRHGDLTMLKGGAVQVRMSGGRVEINGARILGAESIAANGVVHRIDTLLLPKGVRLASDAA